MFAKSTCFLLFLSSDNKSRNTQKVELKFKKIVCWLTVKQLNEFNFSFRFRKGYGWNQTEVVVQETWSAVLLCIWRANVATLVNVKNYYRLGSLLTAWTMRGLRRLWMPCVQVWGSIYLGLVGVNVQTGCCSH